MKDLDELKFFGGIEFARSKDGILTHQRKYILELMYELGLVAAKPTAKPIDKNIKLNTEEYDNHVYKNEHEVNDPPTNMHVSQRLIGKLLHLTMTGPYIAYSVQTLSQVLQQPKTSHMDAAIRLVKHIKNKPGQEVLMSSQSNLGESIVSWKSKSTISRSSDEDEYRSIVATMAKLVWLLGLLKKIGIDVKQLAKIYNNRKFPCKLALIGNSNIVIAKLINLQMRWPSDIHNQDNNFFTLEELPQSDGGPYKSTQGEKSVRCFYSGLLRLREEQDQYFAASISVAGLKDFMTTMKRTRTVHFLMKLRSEFEPLRASILNREKLPTLDVVVSEVLREETWLGSHASMGNSLFVDTVMAAYRNSSSKNSMKLVQCYHCKETGHVISHCKKRNYCNYCKKDGHIILECRKKFGSVNRSTPYKAFHAMTRDVGTQHTPETQNAPQLFDRNNIDKMIQDSLAAALPNAISTALTATYPGKNKILNSMVWHIDSVASNHMTGNQKLFSNLSKTLSTHEIVTANGHVLSASGTTYDLDPFLDNDITSMNTNSLPHQDDCHNVSLNSNNKPPAPQNIIDPVRRSSHHASPPSRYGYSTGGYDRSYALLTTLNSIVVTNTYMQASGQKCLEDAMNKELAAL
ncbi:hypothetical protein FXO37_34117 [Capsicum annuum]|nr:hypothetical protein FXO37_34117 [Capsicum annuum]